MHSIRSLLLLILFIGVASGHESEKDHHFSYTFKDKIHGMCAGHHHLDDIELKEICNHFSEHFSDILELQAKPPEFLTEKYINNMTALVIFSDTLTKDQKHNFYRRSYDQALEAGKNGSEWKLLLGLLVERTDALSMSELQDLMKNTTHEPMKPLIEKALKRKQKITHTISRPTVQDSHTDVASKERDEEQESSRDEDFNRLPWFIAGIVLLGSLALYLRVFNGRTNS